MVLLFNHSATLITTSQTPPTTGFSCSDSETTHPCKTYVSYHVQQPNFMNLRNISDLFGVSPSSIASASSLPSDENDVLLVPDQLLLVPVDCGCRGNSSFSNLTYHIKEGDSFYLVSITSLENLTDWQAVVELNPGLSPTHLQSGDEVVFPLFCQCPSMAQRENGIEFLITYVWRTGDTLRTVADELGASVDDIILANHESIDRPVLVAVPGLPVIRQMNPKRGKAKQHLIIISVIVAISAISAILIVYLVCHRRKKFQTVVGGKKLKKTVTYEQKLFPGVSGYLNKPIMYDARMIMEATMDLDSYYKIQGSVYRVSIDGKVMAVKKIKGVEATEEIQILQKVNHANLVKLMGVSCDAEGSYFLVYEYAENGSLDKWLFCKSASSSRTETLSFLSWSRRLQIALDVANGLQYLHEHVQPKIAHRDIRSSNILLDSRFRGKIANFSVARSAGDYSIAPKVDVFAFGVVLLELLSGKKAMVTAENGEILLLAKEIKTVLEVSERRVEKLRKWMDPYLENLYPINGALSLAMLAMACTIEKASARPSMAEIVFNLTVLVQSPSDWLEDAWPAKKLDEEEILRICSPITGR
ncbi:Serine/threonine receptor-like kinase NFP [Linum perenne]